MPDRKFKPFGTPWEQGGFSVQEERRGMGTGPARHYRLVTITGAQVVMSKEEMFDLTELLDDVCDYVEDTEDETG